LRELRPAGVLCFLEWAWTGGSEPQAIDARMSRARCCCGAPTSGRTGAAALPLVGVSDKHSHARTALRWLWANGKTTVSREEMRREALSRQLDAGETQALLDMLGRAGWLRETTAKMPGPGRPARRWEINPGLFKVHL
jgi:hypothetical protein